ncbi:MAG: alpha/beta hydrolase [Hyphomonas sp.]|nr:alpha/beta hydrolase [Hyphomonas sp.]
MKTSQADILIIPGWSSSGPDHWQTRWEKNLKTARRVEQDDWLRPDKDAWVSRIVEAAAQSVRPVVLVAHSLGAMAVAHAGSKLARLPAPPVGAFLVAPADVDNAAHWPVTAGETFRAGAETGFAPVPRAILPTSTSPADMGRGPMDCSRSEFSCNASRQRQ